MKALHRIFRVLTCFPVVLSLLLLPLLPERIPAHYNLYGQVDRWGSRLEVLLLPLCCLVGGLIWKRLIQKMSLTQPQNQKPMLVAGCSLLAALDALSCVILFFSFSAADVPQTGLLLPQLLNIFMGEMSFVGPRPERPTVYDDLDGKVENFRSRMQVMPGLTGYAQVNGGYDLNPAEKLKYDLIYINHCSVLFDLWCLLKTIPVVFTMKGAR
mgnify:CR=1 FL=1